MKRENENQLTLFTAGSVINDAISTVFGAKEIKSTDKNGITHRVGTSIQMNARKQIAAELGLTKKSDKDALNAAILAQSDEAFRQVKAEIAGLDSSWTLRKVANRVMSNGEQQITMVARRIVRAKGPSPEVIAKSLGLSLEEVLAMMEKAREKEQATDVNATVDAGQPAPEPELPGTQPEAKVEATV